MPELTYQSARVALSRLALCDAKNATRYAKLATPDGLTALLDRIEQRRASGRWPVALREAAEETHADDLYAVVMSRLLQARDEGDEELEGELSELIDDDDAMAALAAKLGVPLAESIEMQEGWTAQKTKRGTIKAVGTGAQDGRTLYGKRAEIALRGTREEGKEVETRRDERTRRAGAAMDVARMVGRFETLTPDHVQALRDNLPSMTRAQIRLANGYLQARLGGARRHAELVGKLNDWLTNDLPKRQAAEEQRAKAEEETLTREPVGEDGSSRDEKTSKQAIRAEFEKQFQIRPDEDRWDYLRRMDREIPKAKNPVLAKGEKTLVLRDALRKVIPGIRVVQHTTKGGGISIFPPGSSKQFSVEERKKIEDVFRGLGAVTSVDYHHFVPVESSNYPIGSLYVSAFDADGPLSVYKDDGKESHPGYMMTRAKFVQNHPEYQRYLDATQSQGTGQIDAMTTLKRMNRDHRSAVESALAAGKPVPSEVLADYPDLAAKYGTKADKPNFTGTDSLGREWVDGKLVAKQEEDGAGEKAGAAKEKKAPRAKKDNPVSLLAAVRRMGGIDPDFLKKQGYNVDEEFKQFGLINALRKGSRNGLDTMATALHSEGHIQIPEGENGSDYLLRQLQAKAESLESILNNSENRYAAAAEESYRRLAESGYDAASLEEVVRAAEEAGVRESDEEESWERSEELANEELNTDFDPSEFGTEQEATASPDKTGDNSADEPQRDLFGRPLPKTFSSQKGTQQTAFDYNPDLKGPSPEFIDAAKDFAKERGGKYQLTADGKVTIDGVPHSGEFINDEWKFTPDTPAADATADAPTGTPQGEADGKQDAGGEGKAKEPWEMTRGEYSGAVSFQSGGPGVKLSGALKKGSLPESHIRLLSRLPLDIGDSGFEGTSILRGMQRDGLVTRLEKRDGVNIRVDWVLTDKGKAAVDAQSFTSDEAHTKWQEHGESVAAALAAGKPVPPAVLADYPDLAAQYGKPDREKDQPAATAQPDPADTIRDDAAAGEAGKAITPEQAAARKWTKNDDGTYTSPNGMVWRKAAAGGEESPVNGKFFVGGSLMPIHGRSNVNVEKGDGTGDVPMDNVGAGGQKEQEGQSRRGGGPAKPREVDPEVQKENAGRQRKWDEMNKGTLGKLMWLGDTPNGKAMQHAPIPYGKWKDFVASIGPEGVKRIISTLEPELHGAIDSNVKALRDRGEAISPDTEEWSKNEPKRRADDEVSLLNGKKHEKEFPGSHYARQLIGEMLDPQNTPNVNGVERLHRLESLLSRATGNSSAAAGGPSIGAKQTIRDLAKRHDFAFGMTDTKASPEKRAEHEARAKQINDLFAKLPPDEAKALWREIEQREGDSVPMPQAVRDAMTPEEHQERQAKRERERAEADARHEANRQASKAKADEFRAHQQKIDAQRAAEDKAREEVSRERAGQQPPAKPPETPSVASGGSDDGPKKIIHGRTVIPGSKPVELVRPGKNAAKPGDIITRDGKRYVVTKASTSYVSEDEIEDQGAWGQYPKGKGHYTHYEATPVEDTEQERQADAAKADASQKEQQAKKTAQQETDDKWNDAVGGYAQSEVVPPSLPPNLKWEPIGNNSYGHKLYVATLPDGRKVGRRVSSSYDDYRESYYVPKEMHRPEMATEADYANVSHRMKDADPDEYLNAIGDVYKRTGQPPKRFYGSPAQMAEYDRRRSEALRRIVDAVKSKYQGKINEPELASKSEDELQHAAYTGDHSKANDAADRYIASRAEQDNRERQKREEIVQPQREWLRKNAYAIRADLAKRYPPDVVDEAMKFASDHVESGENAKSGNPIINREKLPGYVASNISHAIDGTDIMKHLDADKYPAVKAYRESQKAKQAEAKAKAPAPAPAPPSPPKPSASLPTKKVSTSRGERHVYSFSPDAGFWDAWKRSKDELRDRLGVSVGKDQRGNWTVSIWGATPDEVQANAAKLKAKGVQSIRESREAVIDMDGVQLFG